MRTPGTPYRRIGYIALCVACCALVGCAERPVGVVLTYQVNRQAIGNNVVVDQSALVEAIGRRLGGLGRVRPIAGSEQFEVGIYGQVDAAQLASIKRRLASEGVLEFRIAADSRRAEDKTEIEQAMSLPPSQKDVTIGGTKVAEWVAYAEEEFGPPDAPDDRGIVKRMAGDRPEALVLIDVWNVTGDYLRIVNRGIDMRGAPAVDFAFNSAGAARMRQLTSQNRPHPARPGEFRYLGIILDKRILSAPRINDTITDRGQISGGGLSEVDVDAMVAVLNAGRLPSPIRLVAEESVALPANAQRSGGESAILMILAIGLALLVVVIVGVLVMRM